ncbi:hypothetical protein L581_2431 [Serratia fonticola AU-AP2C]|nr:hypothetical protein L581_2431 [Serratia fonticola AU-AP2C]
MDIAIQEEVIAKHLLIDKMTLPYASVEREAIVNIARTQLAEGKQAWGILQG